MKKLTFIFIISLLVCSFGSIAYALNLTNEATFSKTEQIQGINTIGKLDNYLASVKLINSQIVEVENELKEIATTITFSDYLTFEALDEYAKEHSLNIQQIQVRGIDSEGSRITVFAILDQNLSQTKANIIRDAEINNYQILGVTDVYSYVNAKNLVAISNDPKTYLADTTADKNVFAKIYGTEANISTNNNQSSFKKSLAWELEDLGILK